MIIILMLQRLFINLLPVKNYIQNRTVHFQGTIQDIQTANRWQRMTQVTVTVHA